MYYVIKNALVLTLDSSGTSGYFNIVVKNGIISDVLPASLKMSFSDAEVIDASGKLIMPGLINSGKNSTYSLTPQILDNLTYNSFNEDLSVNIIKNHLRDDIFTADVKNLFCYSFNRSLLSGETSVVEMSCLISSDILEDNNYNNNVSNEIIYCADKAPLQLLFYHNKKQFITSHTFDKDITNYSITEAKKLIKKGYSHLYLDIFSSKEKQQNFQDSFKKSAAKMLHQNGLLTSDVVLVNPAEAAPDELSIINNSHSAVLILQSDCVNLSSKLFEVNNVASSIERCIIGTGYTGISLLNELKLLYSCSIGSGLTPADFLKLASKNPARIFNLKSGSIEKGKSADFIFFSVNEIQGLFNFINVDEISLSKFILTGLSANNISAVYKNGKLVVEENKLVKANDIDADKAIQLSSKLYEISKFRDFEERVRREIRVESVSINSTVKEEASIADESETLKAEDDFKIIGVKKYTEEIYQDVINTPSSQMHIKRVNSMLNGFDFGEVSNTIVLNNITDKQTKPNENKATYESVNKEMSEKPKEESPVVFTKAKIRFGFNDEE